MSEIKLTTESPLYDLDRIQILELLGPPDSEGPMYMHYDVGFLGDRGYLTEPRSLIFRFANDSGEYAIPNRIVVSN